MLPASTCPQEAVGLVSRRSEQRHMIALPAPHLMARVSLDGVKFALPVQRALQGELPRRIRPRRHQPPAFHLRQRRTGSGMKTLHMGSSLSRGCRWRGMLRVA
jgi:hypothetical protein